MAKKFYQIADKLDSRKIAEFLSKDGQVLLPFLELICNTEQVRQRSATPGCSGQNVGSLR